MTPNASAEPPIDLSLSHYLEERALAVALDKARSPSERTGIERLLNARRVLMEQRAAFVAETTAKRHARGEIYTSARVAAINGMGPSKAQLDALAHDLYDAQTDTAGVLQTHARVHFGNGLVSARLLLAQATPDIEGAWAEMQRHEERFAAEWIETAGGTAFVVEMRSAQRTALCALRTATRPIYLCTHPETADLDDASAAALGKAWSKLDALAEAAGEAPLSAFIALPDEPAAAGTPAAEVLQTTEALRAALNEPQHKIPGKRAVVAALERVRATLAALPADGRAQFEIDL